MQDARGGIGLRGRDADTRAKPSMNPAPAPPPFFLAAFVTSVAAVVAGEYVDRR
jgi:hypothetical protein